jgi:hypothetical protein
VHARYEGSGEKAARKEIGRKAFFTAGLRQVLFRVMPPAREAAPGRKQRCLA